MRYIQLYIHFVNLYIHLYIVDPDVLSKDRKPVSFDQELPETLTMSSQEDNPSKQIGT